MRQIVFESCYVLYERWNSSRIYTNWLLEVIELLHILSVRASLCSASRSTIASRLCGASCRSLG